MAPTVRKVIERRFEDVGEAATVRKMTMAVSKGAELAATVRKVIE